MGSEIQRPNHLKSGQKCLAFEWFGFRMVGTIAIGIAKAQPFENQTILNLIQGANRVYIAYFCSLKKETKMF